MADLRRDDRAQLLLIAGFVLAASFLALALVMNSVIYTENLATRGEQAQAEDAVAYRADVIRGTAALIEYANDNRSDYSDIRDDFVVSVESMSNRTATQQAVDGQLTNTTVRSTTEGTRIGQRNASRNMTNVTGSPDWDLASDVRGTRSFTIDVTDSDALEHESDLDILGLGAEDPFTVRVSDGPDDWGVRFYRNTSHTIVNVTDAGECASGHEPEIDLTAGTMDGEPCSALTFGDGVSGPYTVSFEDADEVQGNLSLIVNSTSYDTANYDSEVDSPFATSAIYGATVHVRLESTDMVYATDAMVIPGESND